MAHHPVPRVSVIIPNYNHGAYLEQRIRSVLDQTFQDFEVILLDDASTDNSREVFERFAAGLFEQSRTGILPVSEMAESSSPNGGSSVAPPTERSVPTGRDPDIGCRGPTFSCIVPAGPRSESVGLPVRAVFSDTNSGAPFRQWNKGVELALGDYVWIAESDDTADPRFLARLVPLLDENPRVGLAYCQSWVTDQDHTVLRDFHNWTDRLHPTRWHTDFINNGQDECARYLIHKNTIPNASAVLLRRAVYQQMGGACETMRLCGDWMTWVKILLNSDIAYVAEPLNYWRKHPHTVSATLADSPLPWCEQFQVTATILRHVDVPASRRAEVADYVTRRWASLVVDPRRRRPWGVQCRIYRAARQIDPTIPWRTLRRALGILLGEKPALAPLRRIARGMARATRRVLGRTA